MSDLFAITVEAIFVLLLRDTVVILWWLTKEVAYTLRNYP